MSVSLYITEFCRLFIFAILLFSSLGKGRTFEKFKGNLSDSFHVPKSWTTAITLTIIGLEGFLAVIIFINNHLTYYAMIGALIMFIGFTVFITISVVQDRLVRCNCFGQNEEYISYLDIIRNFVILLACGLYLYQYELIPLSKTIQLFLFGMAFISYLVVTNLKNIATIAQDPKST